MPLSNAERQKLYRQKLRATAEAVGAQICAACGKTLTINGQCRSCCRLGHGAKRPFIEFSGIRYYRDAQGWRASRGQGHGRLHRAIWEAEVGEIPAGHSVIYIDNDHDNNALENLQIIKGRHRSMKGIRYKTNPKNIRPQHWWTPSAEERLIALHSSGKSFAAIADALGCSRSAVAGKVRRLGLNLQHSQLQA